MERTEQQACVSASLDRRSTGYTDHLLGCMQRRLAVITALHGLSRTQAEVVGQPADSAVTLGILARKQPLLQELDQIQAELATYHRDDPEQRNWRSTETRRECQQVSSEGNRLLEEILRMEQSAVKCLETQRDAVAAQLQSGHSSQAARSAYTAENSLSGGSLDIGDL